MSGIKTAPQRISRVLCAVRGRGTIIVAAGVVVCLCAGCEVPPERRDAGSTIPWNAPAEWEQQPNMSAPFTW